MLLQDIEAMEEEINKFIEENDIEVIDIKFTGTKGYIHALVIYKDKN
jgi:glutamine synthetase